MSRHPTTEPTRDEFLDGDAGRYCLAFRLTQTARVGDQVEIGELAALAEELRLLVEDDYDLPVEYYDVDAHDASITVAEVRRRYIDEEAIEADVESLAAEHDVGLAKNINLSRGGTSGPLVFVKYTYGWSGTSAEMAADPHCPAARTEWVGGSRGRPETMSPSQFQIKSVERIE